MSRKILEKEFETRLMKVLINTLAGAILFALLGTMYPESKFFDQTVRATLTLILIMYLFFMMQYEYTVYRFDVLEYQVSDVAVIAYVIRAMMNYDLEDQTVEKISKQISEIIETEIEAESQRLDQH